MTSNISSRTFISLISAFALLFNLSCRKPLRTSEMCPQILSERSPDRVLLRFEHAATGESLISPQGLKSSDIKVTQVASGVILNNWRIFPDSPSAPTSGLLEVILLENKAGKYSYKITLGKTAEISLNFNLTRHEPTGPCSAEYTKAGSFEISSHPFSPLTINGKSYPEILIVKI